MLFCKYLEKIVQIEEHTLFTNDMLGLTPQRPLRRAYQQDSEAVKKFLTEEYPEIKKQAKRCRATIYRGDESSIRSDYHSGTTWGAKGETPIVKTTGARFRVNMISAKQKDLCDSKL